MYIGYNNSSNDNLIKSNKYPTSNNITTDTYDGSGTNNSSYNIDTNNNHKS